VAKPSGADALAQLWTRSPADQPTPSPTPVRISEGRNYVEPSGPTDGDNSRALKATPPMAFHGVLSESGERDRYRFSAVAGDKFDIDVWGDRIASPIDSMIEVFDPHGRSIAANDDAHEHDSSLRFVAPTTGDYTLEIGDHLGRGGPLFAYSVEFVPIRPRVVLNLAADRSTDSLAEKPVVVPRGSRVAFLVAARRIDVGGPIEVKSGLLKEGLELRAEPIAAGTHLGMAICEASPDAELGATLTTLSGAVRSAEDSPPANVAYRQQVAITRGEPRQTPYHIVTLDQFPIVVVEEAPFSLEVVAPAEPLVKDGRFDLQVVAKRAKGFEEEIELSTPLLPPWLEAPEQDVLIPAGESQVTFPITAHPDAFTASWKLTIEGTAEGSQGPVKVAAAPFSLQVAEPMVAATIQSAAARNGDQIAVRCNLEWKSGFRGSGKAILLGLPKATAGVEATFEADDTSVDIPVSVGADTPVSVHNSLFVELTLFGEAPIVHYSGRGGELEVLEEGSNPREKRSRLEILRDQAGL
ncbi:MAG: PPC domain-containing protein, partial [Planctomycetota bacterium]